MKKLRGSSIKLSGEVNIASKDVVLKGKKSKTWEDLKEPYKDKSKDFEKLLPQMLGGLPVTAGVPSEKDKLMLKLMGGLAACAGVNITKNPNGSYSVSYTNALNRVRNNAKPVTGELNEEGLRQEIYKIISAMLEKGGPAFASWNALLKDLMKNHGMEDFLKGARAALCAMTGDPVNANTGNFIYIKEDIKIQSRIPLSFTRSYNSKEEKVGVFGKGWRHSYEISVSREENGYIVHLSDGQDEAYLLDDEGNIISVFDDFDRLQKTKDGFEYKSGEGLSYLFNKEGKLLCMERKDKVKVVLSYDTKGRLLSVSDILGSSLYFLYDDLGKLREVKDHTGRKIEYRYESGQLGTVYYGGQRAYDYFYEKELLVKIKNPRGVYVLENLYDGADRVKIQRFADGGIIRYEYDSEERKTFVTNQNENIEVHVHDENFRNIESEYAGESESFTYDERNLLTSYTDKKGNTTTYKYDKKGNLTSCIHPDGEVEGIDYDENGNVSIYYKNKEEIERYTYDDKGRFCERKNALGEITSIEYKESEYKKDKETKESVIMTLPDGSKSKVSYDERGNISRIEEENGSVLAYEYDALNRVRASIDGNKNRTEFSYNDKDLLTGVKDAMGNTCRYEYTENGKLSLFEDFRGSITKLNYNEMNKIKDFTLPDGENFKMEYDLCQNLTKEIHPDGGEVEYIYNAANLVEKKILQNKGEYEYRYDANGNLISVTDPLGESEEYSYDERNRLVYHKEKAGAVTEYEYGKRSLKISNELGTYTCNYDILGRIVLETDMLGNTKKYEYNELGQVSSVKTGEKETVYKYRKGGLLHKKIYPDKRYEIFSYDKNQNLIKRENDKGEFLEFTYDKLNRITKVKNSFLQEQSFEYDAMGNVIKEIDALGNSTSYTYSPGGKLTSVLDAMGNRTEYGYDKAGRLDTVYRHEGSRELLSCIEDEERKHSLKEISKTKEKYGRQISESLKEANVSRITRYKRNLMGDVECITNAFGEEEYFSYDLLGRVILKKDMDGYETRYSYTKAGDIKTVLYADGYKAEYEYDSLGKLTKVKDALGVISIENDKLGRTTKVTDHNSKEVRYSYGKFGERLRTIYPDKKSIDYGYDEDLRLVSLISGDKEITYSYDKEGRLIRKDMPDEISSLYSYDERGLLSSLCHMKGDRKLEEYIYGYDLLGNKTKVVRQRDVDHKGIKEDKNKEKIIHKLWEDSSTFNYEYDSLSRLVAVKREEKEVCTYTYDAFGNRSKMKKDGIEAVYTYDALDRLVRVSSLHTNESYEYDKRGNLIGVTERGKKIKAYEYGALGRLGLSYSNLGNARSYDYDGMGNRIGCREYKFESKGLGEDRLKSINELDLAKKEPVYEERYVLDRTRPYNNMLQRSILDRVKEQTQSYAWDFNAVFMEEEEKVYTYLNDELGSTIRLLEKEGKSQTIYGYDEFGKDTYGTQGQVQPFGYTGYRYDAVAETYFAQAREYVAGVGRFGGEDWIKGSISYPTSLNAYGYCHGNPMVWVDRDGKLKKAGKVVTERIKKISAEKDVLQNDNGAPYVGVFYLNSISGAGGNGHIAMLLLRSDDTGDLYSYDCVDPSLTVLAGYSDANVNHAYGINLGEIWGVKDENSEYRFTEVIKAYGKKASDKYNRGIYFPIKDEDGKKMAQAAKETILSVNGIGYDEKDYHLLANNCDINTRRWMQAGGINIDTWGRIVPNGVYDYVTGEIDKGVKVKYVNAMYGDLHDIWSALHPQLYFVPTDEIKCTTCD